MMNKAKTVKYAAEKANELYKAFMSEKRNSHEFNFASPKKRSALRLKYKAQFKEKLRKDINNMPYLDGL